MSKQKQVVAIILDKSGSMCGTREQTVNGYNEHIQQIKSDADDDLDILTCLVTFNGQVFEHFWLMSSDELEEAKPEDYEPKGSTAMRDGMGYTIKKLQETCKDFSDEDTSYLVVMISDGYENASVHFSGDALREIISGLQAKDNWTFTYMGCDQNYLKKVSEETAIPISNMAAWDNKTIRACAGGMSASSAKMGSYFDARKSGEKKMDVCYHSLNACESADYTQGDVDVVNDVVNDVEDVAGKVSCGEVNGALGAFSVGHVADLSNNLSDAADLVNQTPPEIKSIMPVASKMWKPQAVAKEGGVFTSNGAADIGKYT